MSIKPAVSLAVAAALLPSAALAQDEAMNIETTIGLSVGIHDIGVNNRNGAIAPIDRTGALYGAFVAMDKRVGSNLFAGLEANTHIGTGPVNSDYGASLRFGYRAATGTKAYVRAGYQWVNIDYGDPLNVPAGRGGSSSVSVSHYLVGAGIEVPVYRNVSARVNFDTIGFDTLRGTSGVGIRF